MSDFSCLGLTDYLQCDARPTFVVDRRLDTNNVGPDVLTIQYQNRSFVSFQDSVSCLTSHGDQLVIDAQNEEAKIFASWTWEGKDGSSIDFLDVRWTSIMLHQQWQVISGISVLPNIESLGCVSVQRPSRKSSKREADGRLKAAPLGTFSSTILNPKNKPLSDHHKSVQDHNWSGTPWFRSARGIRHTYHPRPCFIGKLDFTRRPQHVHANLRPY